MQQNFILAEEPFAKALRSFETCVLVNNKSCGKLLPSLESRTTFNESFKVTSVPLFIRDFNLLSYELDNFTFKVFVLFYIYIILKQNKTMEHIHNTFTVPCEKSKMVSFVSSLMKNIVAPSSLSRFPVKLIWRIAFGSASSACFT